MITALNLNFLHSITEEAIEQWKTIRGNYRRAVVKISKWCKQPSGSGKQAVKKPRPYKYAAELSFLNDVFDFEETMDSMTTSTPAEHYDDAEESETDDKVINNNTEISTAFFKKCL